MENLCQIDKIIQNNNSENDLNKNALKVENVLNVIIKDNRRKKNHSKDYLRKIKSPSYKLRQKQHSRKWYLKTHEKRLLERREKRKDPKDKAYRKIYNSKNQDKIKKYALKRCFKISIEEYNNLWQKQNGVCALCGNPETVMYSNGKITKLRALAVDHDHKTGRIRGLLCHFCNVGLGHFKDDKNLLLKAIEYIG
jgi:hypothetical protein